MKLSTEKDYENIISHRKRTAANRYIAITIVKSLFTRDPHAFLYIHFPHLISVQ